MNVVTLRDENGNESKSAVSQFMGAWVNQKTGKKRYASENDALYAFIELGFLVINTNQ